jgi:hypothetical protein
MKPVTRTGNMIFKHFPQMKSHGAYNFSIRRFRMPANVLQEAKAALEGLNTDKILEIYADRFKFEDTPSKLLITDQKKLGEYFQQLFSLPKVSFSDIRLYEAETFAAIEWTWSGVNHATGEAFRVRGASIIELESGKVRRESIYYDPRPAST